LRKLTKASRNSGCEFNIRYVWTTTNIKEVVKLLPELETPIFHICSGVSNIGDVRMDRSFIHNIEGHTDPKKYQGSCNIRGDMLLMPFKSGSAGSVICDPPYRYDFNNPELISELVRICKPKGKILFIAPWVPNHKNIKVIDTDLWNVGKNGAYHKIRTLFYKSNAQLDDFI